MRFQDYIQEKYCCMCGSNTIFENPDKSEIREAIKYNECRFIINFDKKKLYIWDATAGVHQTVITDLVYKNKLPTGDMYDILLHTCLAGFAERSGNKLILTRLYEGFTPSTDLNKMDWINNANDKWLNTYFDHPFIKYFKTKYDKYKEYFPRI
jgi:hypothetical protein